VIGVNAIALGFQRFVRSCCDSAALGENSALGARVDGVLRQSVKELVMRKLILAVGLIVVGIACGDAVGEILDSGVPDAGAETPGDGSSMQYVGNTSQTFQGGVGLYPAYAACQSDYGPGHRICTSDEIKFTTKLPQLTEDAQAWYTLEGCNGWASSSSSTNGSIVSGTGTFSSGNCQVTRPFACCGPK
jgi:hypothetical protein